MCDAYERRRDSKWVKTRTFPDACPEDIAVVHVEHNPLSVQRVLVHRSSVRVSGGAAKRSAYVHVPSGVVAGDVPALGHLVVGGQVRAEALPSVGLFRLRRRHGVLQGVKDGTVWTLDRELTRRRPEDMLAARVETKVIAEDDEQGL